MFYLSLFLILAGGAILFYLCSLLKLPALIGYLAWGILLGYLGWIDPKILAISAELRKMALVIILIKAGLTLDISDLKKVGRPAILMSFLPATVEMCAIGLLAGLFFSLGYETSFLLGAVLGAVSPAVVIPMMSKLLDEKRGVNKGVPQLVIAGSSIDDIIMIVFYQAFLTLATKGEFDAMVFLNIPISIITGVGVGVLLGFLLSYIFSKIHIRDSMKLVFLFGVGIGLVTLESYLPSWLGFSSLLSCIAMSLVYAKRNKEQGKRMAMRCSKIWVPAEIILFVLVGASIKMEYFGMYFWPALALILIALFFRMIAVQTCLIKTGLNKKERLFVGLSYLPKATVQAAIGGGLLDAGNALRNETLIASGAIVLAVSVVAILITAPLGAISMNLTYKHLLTNDNIESMNVL